MQYVTDTKPRPSSRLAALATLFVGVMVSLVHGALAGTSPDFDPNAVFSQSKAKYAAMHSYADTGSVTVKYQSPGAPASIDTFTFATSYSPPRMFQFNFRNSSTGERFVVWASGADFNTWWSATKVHEDYPQGQGATAFAMAAEPTKGAALTVSPLLFSTAGLHGAISDLSDLHAAGIESVNGHRCYKIVGTVGLAYGTGTVTGGRATTIWIDATSLLIRKLFEDTPQGTGAGFVSTTTTTFEPQADAPVDPKKFNFQVPPS